MRWMVIFLGFVALVGCQSAQGVQPSAAESDPTTNSASPKTSERSAVPDGINDRFLDPDLSAEDWVDRWEVEAREIYASRNEIVAAMQIEPGHAVADIGAGTGLFVGPFSQAVGPDGRVVAIDISPRFVDHLRTRVMTEGLDNVEVRMSSATSTDLPRQSVDIAYLCDVYHHFEFHEAMLASLESVIRSGGTLVIVDFERIEGVSREWVLGHVRAGKQQVISEVEAAGFELIEEVEVDGLSENYLLRFRRP